MVPAAAVTAEDRRKNTGDATRGVTAGAAGAGAAGTRGLVQVVDVRDRVATAGEGCAALAVLLVAVSCVAAKTLLFAENGGRNVTKCRGSAR